MSEEGNYTKATLWVTALGVFVAALGPFLSLYLTQESQRREAADCSHRSPPCIAASLPRSPLTELGTSVSFGVQPIITVAPADSTTARPPASKSGAEREQACLDRHLSMCVAQNTCAEAGLLGEVRNRIQCLEEGS
jgi:hypothetical protein